MITIERLGTWFIAWKSGTDLGVYFSDNKSKTSHQADIPIRRPLDILDGRISMDIPLNMVHRWQNKV